MYGFSLKVPEPHNFQIAALLCSASSVGLLYLLFNQVEIASVVLTKAYSVDLLYLPFN